MTTRERLGRNGLWWRDGYVWTTVELRTLERMAKDRTAMEVAKALGRTPAAVLQKATRSGISFRR